MYGFWVVAPKPHLFPLIIKQYSKKNSVLCSLCSYITTLPMISATTVFDILAGSSSSSSSSSSVIP